MKRTVATLALVASVLASTPAVASAVAPRSERSAIPVVRVDKQCRTGHNPSCHEVYVENWVLVANWIGDYPPPGIWIKFTPKR